MTSAPCVVDASSVAPDRAEDGTAETRTILDPSTGCPNLTQRVARFAPGRSRPRGAPGREDVGFVVAGRGTLLIDGVAHALEPGTAFHVAEGERYEVDNPGPDDLVWVEALVPLPADTRPGPDPGPLGPRAVTVRLDDQPVHRTGDRTFRVLVAPGTGCRGVTQFVGDIPPGRAPAHTHPYDEVVYIVSGEGVVHLGDGERAVATGSCVYLPPGTPHCIENRGPGPLRLLGVFHPAGSPAAKSTLVNGSQR